MLSLVHGWITAMIFCMVCLNQISQKLQRIHNAAVRLLTGTKKFDLIVSVLKSLHWFSVEKRTDFKVLLLIYRALPDQAPSYMRDIVQKRTNIRTLCSTFYRQWVVPRSRLIGFRDRAFSIAASRLWNALPRSFTSCTSVGAYKKALRHTCLNLRFS